MFNNISTKDATLRGLQTEASEGHRPRPSNGGFGLRRPEARPSNGGLGGYTLRGLPRSGPKVLGWLEFWACQIWQERFELITSLWLEFAGHCKLDMFIQHMQNRMLCFHASVLHLLYRQVPFSMCTKLEPQLHSEVLSSCGSSLVGVDVHNVAVARVLGTSDSAKAFGAYYSIVARGWGT